MIGRIANKLNSLFLSHTYPFHSIGKRVSITRSVDINRAFAPYISIGNNVIIAHDTWFHVQELRRDGKPVIVLEDGCVIGRHCVISAKNHIHVGKNVIFAPSVLLMDHNHEFHDWETPIKFQGTTPGGTIRIEEGCWLGYGAAVVCSDGPLVVGRNSVIGANSLVAGNVASNTVIVGNPGRPVKHFNPAEQKWMMGGRVSKPTYA